MEPIAIVGAGVVIYCGWLAAQDDLRSWRQFRRECRQRREQQRAKRCSTAAVAGPAGGAAARWPVPVASSV